MEELNKATQNQALNIESRIAYDKLTFFYLSMPIVLIGHMAGALLFSALLYRAVDTYNMLVWLTLSLILFLYRFYHYFQFKNESESNKLRDYKMWLHRFYSDVLISGVLWGSSAILMFPSGNMMHQMIIVIFIFAISFTAMGNLAAKAELLFAYALVSFVPLIVQLLIIEGEIYANLGMIVIALMLILIVVSRYFGNIINVSLKDHQHFLEIKHTHEVLQERFFSLFERAPVGIFYFNQSLKILDSNARFLEIVDAQNKNEIVNAPLDKVENTELIASYKSVFKNKVGSYRGPLNSMVSDKLIYVDLNTVPLQDGEGRIKGGITIIKDITEEVNAKESMVRNAYYDILTNIPNRTLLMDRIDESIEQSKNECFYAAILYMDLDHFRKLNETFGHDMGDSALKQVAERTILVIDKEDTLARLGGDKFALLIPKLSDDNDRSCVMALEKAHKIQEAFQAPFKIYGADYHMGASIGIHIYPYEEDNAYDILKRAETAMYEAKRQGRNAVSFYEEEMGKFIKEFIHIDNDLRKAIGNNELSMYYQPQLDVQTGEIIGAEALIRWIHPTKGMISTEKFISIAEESGYIVELSYWIIDRVFRDVKRLNEGPKGLTLKHIAININGIHFLRPNFINTIKTMIQKHHISPEWIEIEITEGVIMSNIDEAIKKMNILKAYGIKFSMDDFGTGYSSLSYLSQIPFDSLKIDQSFIMKMKNNPNDAKLVYSIIDLAKHFDLEVVAEGVENAEVLKMLKKSTCNTYQGFYAHRPMPFDEFIKLV